jgi:hypothetical protein
MLIVKGHKRIVTPLGERPRRRSLPIPEGFNVSCLCGWDGGHFSRSLYARQRYSAHAREVAEGPSLCRICGNTKLRSEMRPDCRSMCLICFSKKGNEWQRRNPKQAARHKRNYQLLRNSGITLDEVERNLAAQEGLCAICKIPIRLGVGVRFNFCAHQDHNHSNGLPRGVLCFRCNVGLGSFKDDPSRLKSAIEYLARYSSDVDLDRRIREQL